MRLKGKVAIVTGAASDIGIGHAIAVLFAREGAAVTVADIEEPGGRDTAERIKQQGGQALFCRADISKSEDVKILTQKTVENFGSIDILVNNAAHLKDSHTVTDTTEEQWDRCLDITLTGAFLCSKYSIPSMIKAGGGAIVNISSVGGLVGFEHNAPYITAKAGLIQLTKSLAIDYGRYNVRANAICPGAIQTRIAPKEHEPHYKYQVSMTVLGRTGRADEIASAALFLASEDSSYVTGAALVVDGGWTLR